MQLDRREPSHTNLDTMVDEGLDTYGWFRTPTGGWQHEELDLSFHENNFSSKKAWKQAAHDVRMGMRRHEYGNLQDSGRHEVDEQLPAFTIQRFEAMRKWIDKGPVDPRKFFFAIGAIQSPKTAALNGYEQGTTCVCGDLEPSWEHVWTCARKEVPTDLLLRRFLTTAPA